MAIFKNTSLTNIYFNFFYQIKKAYVNNYPWLSSIIEFPKYLSILRKNKSNLELELPWITFKALRFLENIELNNKNVFEYGSGGSSLYFYNRGANTISVEHDEEWFNLVRSKLHNNSFVELKLVEPEFSSNSNVISVNDKKYEGYSFENYVDSISIYPNNFFDLIVIDGRARPFCLIKSLSKVKCGGYILFDNSNRSSYKEGLEIVKDWLVFRSYGPTVNDFSFNETSFYQKPKRN